MFSLIQILGIVQLSVMALASQKVFLIRHGEKPLDGGNGLTAYGEERAQYLRHVFGADSGYNIGYIMAEKPKGEKRTRAKLTVEPLAEDLGLTVDISCGKTKAECVAKSVKKYLKKSDKNVLVCWEHKMLTEIASELGVSPAPVYPPLHYDLIWTIEDGKLLSITSEGNP